MRTVMMLCALVSLAACGGTAIPECEECAVMSAALRPRDCDRCEPAELDSDGDGIVDGRDQCPNEPETYNGYQDSDGCPDVAPVLTIPTSLSGTWSGSTSLGIADGGSFTRWQTETISVGSDGSKGTLSGFCPDGSGAVTLSPTSGSDGGQWTGIYSCPPGPWGSCDSPNVPLYANMLLLKILVTPTLNGISIRTEGSVAFTDRDDEHPPLPCEQVGSFGAIMTGTR